MSPLFINITGENVIVGKSWALDALVIDPKPIAPLLRVVLKCLTSGNYRRIYWHMGDSSRLMPLFEPVRPIASPEMQRLFAGLSDEAAELQDDINSHPSGFPGLRDEVENLVCLFLAWLYRSLGNKDRRPGRRRRNGKPYMIEKPSVSQAARHTLH